MKKLLALILVSISLHAGAQTVTGDRLVGRNAIYLKDYWLKGVQRDTTESVFGDSSKVPTAKAVKDYIAGKLIAFEGGYVAGAGLKLTGTTFSLVDTSDGAGTKFQWLPGKSAFRAGYASGTEWDIANIGVGSIGLGWQTIASGAYTTAIGISTTASGSQSVAIGNGGTASATGSMVFGSGNASGQYSAVLGSGIATGQYSTAIADGTAAGWNSVAIGSGAYTNSMNSIVLGQNNDTSGYYLHSIFTEAPTDVLFNIGNGANIGARSSVLKFLRNGKGTLYNTLSYANRDTTQWKDSTVIDKKYLNDRLAVLASGATPNLNAVTGVDSTTTHSITVSNDAAPSIGVENPSVSSGAYLKSNTTNGGYLDVRNTSGGAVHLRSFSTGGGLYTQSLLARSGTVALYPSLPTDSVNDPINMVWYDNVNKKFMVSDVPTSGSSAGYSEAEVDSVAAAAAAAAVAALPALEANVFMPSLVCSTNIDDVTFTGSLQYMRVGDVVTMSGEVSIDNTTSGYWGFCIDLPVAATSLDTYNAGGTGCTSGGKCFRVYGSGADITFEGTHEGTAAEIYSFSFTYRIVN